MANLIGKAQQNIRFGIMCNGTTFSTWEARCLDKLLSLENVEAALLIVNADAPKYRGKLDKLKQLKDYNKIFWNLYRYLNSRYVSRVTSPVDMGSVFWNVPFIECNVIKKGKFSQYFIESDIVEIEQYNLDFILRFGFNIIRGKILKAARFGVWSFHTDDEEKYRGGPPCFWEIYNGDRVTGAILQRLTDRLDGGIILKKGFFQTINTSYNRNRDNVYFECTNWPAQVCIHIQNGNLDYLNDLPSKTTAPIFHSPNNHQVVLFFLKILWNYIRKRYDSLLFDDKWNIGIVKAPIHSFLKSEILLIEWMPEISIKTFYADPFAIHDGKKIIILYEEYDYYTSKGYISSAKIEGKTISMNEKVMELPVHMSYPYLLENEGQIYCIPETFQAKEVSLYKAEEFPVSWKKVATLIENFSGVDSTIIQYEGQWWLFTTEEGDGANHNLRVWYASELLGPWKPHALNPVKTDVRSARPAGTPFIHQGTLYRPSQDCSETYGGRIVINRVICLTPNEFKEEYAGMIEADKNGPYPKGVHTVSQVGDMTVIDGKRGVFLGKNHAMLSGRIKRRITRIRSFLNKLGKSAAE